MGEKNPSQEEMPDQKKQSANRKGLFDTVFKIPSGLPWGGWTTGATKKKKDALKGVRAKKEGADAKTNDSRGRSGFE